MNQIPGKTITKEKLVAMFENIESQTDWDMSSPMLWGYFFTHHEPTKLESAKEILIGKGYVFVDLYMSEKDHANDPDLYWLHVEKAEHHTPNSLDAANDAHYLFAHELGLDSYDGMDVGPVKK